MSKLDAREEKFCQEYLVDLNGTRAAKEAGYAPVSAHVQSSRLLKKDKVQARLTELQTERQKRTGITQDYVLQGIKEATERCMQARPVLNRKGEPVFVENSEGDMVPAWQFDAFAALKGYELLGRHMKMFTDNVNVTIPGVKVVDDADDHNDDLTHDTTIRLTSHASNTVH